MPTRPDPDKIMEMQRRFDCIRIANLYDALERMGYGNQCLDLSIRPLFPERHLAGMAVTVRGARHPGYDEAHPADPATQPPDPPDVRSVLFPGAVMVIDGGGEPVSGKMGEMTSWSFKQAGAKGMVLDGYIRDRWGLQAIPDYCVCARGTSPIESNRRWRVAAVNVPIAMPGTLTHQVPVYPGDWIVGGDDGVIVVPAAIAEEALAKAEEIEVSEEGMRRDLAAGMSFEDAYKKWGRA
jgi:4-hydroxy-4-methyl-2-oxoglutarate aldolase